MKKLVVFISLFVLAFGCKQYDDRQPQISYAKQKHEQSGKELLELYCYTCHSPEANHDNRIAPPMFAVKKHYIEEGMSRSEFVKSIQSWINEPIAANSKMPGAMRRFGLMPKQQFPEDAVQKISEYLYDNELERPGWFKNHKRASDTL